MMLRYFLGASIVAAFGCAAPLLSQSVDQPVAGVDGGSRDDAPEREAQTAEQSPEDEPALSDLDRAYAAYSLCVDEAAGALAEAGEAAEVIGVRALAACGEERAAYVNAFYFALLPQAGDVDEPVLRARAGRLVSQTDSFLIAKIAESAAAPAEDTGVVPADGETGAE